MAETEEKIDFDHVNSQINGYPRDLLQRFIAGNLPGKFEAEEGDLELSLGLSLNGQFGVDPNRGNKPIRSSSISDFTLTMNDYNRAARVEDTVVHAPLTRTCSLPTETEEGWKKRKEIQSFRRMEAKRKRLQKLRNGRGVREQVGVEIANGGVDFQALPTCQGSIGSGGSGSSGVSESESQPNQGINTCPEAKSPTSVHSQPKQNEQKPVATTGAATAIEKPVKFVGAAMENPSAVEVPVNNNKAAEITRNMMVDMPCVATRGIGPDGKRVEGFLYRYRKGEEVRIVCVCHGSFLSPAEFVKHAGGGDVAHPLKHIVVTPSSFL